MLTYTLSIIVILIYLYEYWYKKIFFELNLYKLLLEEIKQMNLLILKGYKTHTRYYNIYKEKILNITTYEKIRKTLIVYSFFEFYEDNYSYIYSNKELFENIRLICKNYLSKSSNYKTKNLEGKNDEQILKYFEDYFTNFEKSKEELELLIEKHIIEKPKKFKIFFIKITKIVLLNFKKYVKKIFLKIKKLFSIKNINKFFKH